VKTKKKNTGTITLRFRQVLLYMYGVNLGNMNGMTLWKIVSF